MPAPSEKVGNPSAVIGSANVRVRRLRRAFDTEGKPRSVDMVYRESAGVGVPGDCLGGGTGWTRRGDSHRASCRGRIRDIEFGCRESVPAAGNCNSIGEFCARIRPNGRRAANLSGSARFQRRAGSPFTRAWDSAIAGAGQIIIAIPSRMRCCWFCTKRKLPRNFS